MPDTTRSGSDARAHHEPVADRTPEPNSARHTCRLDLSELLSPAQPQWLDHTAGVFALPFEDGIFEHVVVGHDVLEAVRLPECFAELRRVLSRDGEIEIVVDDHDAVERQPSLEDLLVDAVHAFRVYAVTAEHDRIVIKASSDGTHDRHKREDLSAIARAFVRRASEARQMTVDYARNVAELENKYDLAVRDLTHAHEILNQRVKELTGSRSALEATARNLEAVRTQSEAHARTARDEADKLRAELQTLRDEVKYEQWRVKVAQSRKANRIGEQVRRLRQPWRLPEVLYKTARIAASPPLQLPAPVPAGKAPVKSGSQVRQRVQIPPMEFPAAAPRRPHLRVATILDEFSELAFRYEFQIVPVPRDGWKEIFDNAPPNFLLVESAWNGNGGAWKYAFTGEEVPKRAVLDVLDYCREQQIPTVFWNKEDPLEYDLFVRTARHFDWIFTVDENCVEKYRADLGHDRVAVLPFGVQPYIHNPIGSFKPRKENTAFAGTYYSGKYPERKEQIDNLLKPSADLGLHIFSRWESNPRYAFPDDLKKFVVGSLDYAQTLTAYRQYKVFLNVNSVTDSRTMFSRRVLELLACGTAVVSGPSRGMEAMLGAGVVAESTDPETTRLQVRSLLSSPELRDVHAVRGIRAVMNGNTYSDRVDHLLATLGLPTASPRKRVSIVAPTNRKGGCEQILENVGGQNYDDIELIIALHGVDENEDQVRGVALEKGIAHLEILRPPSDWSLGRVLNELCAAASGEYITKMDDDDLYGPNYLSDQLLAFSYTEADIVGKWSRFIFLEDIPCLGVIFPGSEHRYTELVGGGTILARRNVFDAVKFGDRSVGEDTQFLRECAALGFRTYSTDRFNHVYMRYRDASRHTYQPHVLQHLSNTRIISYGSALTHAFI